MKNAHTTTNMGDHEKKPREQRVMEHAEETENGGMPREPRSGVNRGGPGATEATRGGEPPRPVMPPQEPGVGNKAHR